MCAHCHIVTRNPMWSTHSFVPVKCLYVHFTALIKRWVNWYMHEICTYVATYSLSTVFLHLKKIKLRTYVHGSGKGILTYVFCYFMLHIMQCKLTKYVCIPLQNLHKLKCTYFQIEVYIHNYWNICTFIWMSSYIHIITVEHL